MEPIREIGDSPVRRLQLDLVRGEKMNSTAVPREGARTALKKGGRPIKVRKKMNIIHLLAGRGAKRGQAEQEKREGV